MFQKLNTPQSKIFKNKNKKINDLLNPMRKDRKNTKKH